MSKRKRDDDNNTTPFLKGDLVRVIDWQGLLPPWGADKHAENLLLEKQKFGFAKSGIPKPETITPANMEDLAIVEVRPSNAFVAVRLCGSPEGFCILQHCLKLFCRPKAVDSLPGALFRKLWTSRESSGDVVLAAAAPTLAGTAPCVKAHQCILGVASPVFAAAFTGGWKEGTTRTIDVYDTSVETILGVLELMYTGVKPMTLNILESLAFAHKYMMIEVAHRLGIEAITLLTKDNVASVVRLLKDFDAMEGSDTGFLDAVFDAWGEDRDIMKNIMAAV